MPRCAHPICGINCNEVALSLHNFAAGAKSAATDSSTFTAGPGQLAIDGNRLCPRCSARAQKVFPPVQLLATLPTRALIWWLPLGRLFTPLFLFCFLLCHTRKLEIKDVRHNTSDTSPKFEDWYFEGLLSIDSNSDKALNITVRNNSGNASQEISEVAFNTLNFANGKHWASRLMTGEVWRFYRPLTNLLRSKQPSPINQCLKK